MIHHGLHTPENLKRVPSPVPGIEIWTESLDLPGEDLTHLITLLSDDERARLGCFTRQPGAWRFLAARAFERLILNTYLHVAPERIAFGYGPTGKPFIVDPPGSGICFNLSHSCGIALLAVAIDRRVGIDIEYINSKRDVQLLAERTLTPREWQTWRSTTTDAKQRTFYRFWARKEAYLKGTGSGLTVPMNRLDVSELEQSIPGTGARPVVPDELTPWTIYDLALPGFGGATVAALAIEDLCAGAGA